MVLCRLIFLLVFIPIAIGLVEKTSQVDSSNSSTIAPKNLQQKADNSARKSFTLPVEGGSVVVPQANVSVIAEDDAIQLPKLPSENLEESSSKNKGKHVVGRTGAPISKELKDVSTEAPNVAQKSTIMNKLTSKPLPLITNPHKSTTVLQTKKPHKPLVVKSQDYSMDMEKMLSLDLSDGTPKSQANKPGSHPGMIMPVVITILIVPLFAALGYMALKRGQEAWKNRHYKRMDFLLDGMYND